MLEVEPRIIENYVATGQIRIVYRHLLQLGPRSELLAEASECAADQGRFWAVRRELYARLDQSYIEARGNALQIASDLGLDAAAVGACLNAGTHRAAVQADFAAAEAEGVRSRPVFRIGDELIIGSRPYETFQQAIDQALAGQ